VATPADPGSPAHAALITAHRNGFPPGYTPITYENDPVLGRGIGFGIHVLRADEEVTDGGVQERVWVLLQGKARVTLEGRDARVERLSLFDEAPTVVHVGPRTQLRIRAQSERVEWAVARVENARTFAPYLFWPHEIEPEYRGLGLAKGACIRNVRQVFDRSLRPESNVVVGEVINYPGRWSSYPPHHHDQPEIYHYRFSAPQGYGHGEVGERVYKVHQYDTLRIAAAQDHAQVAAPGYAMYYLWIVRHLDDNPYTGFEYSAEHTWLLDPEAPIWEPADGPLAREAKDGRRAGVRGEMEDGMRGELEDGIRGEMEARIRASVAGLSEDARPDAARRRETVLVRGDER
jgi:5-deoxy-glucuronate isomerase